MTERLDVLCCCDADNLLGTLPRSSGALGIRETVGPKGETGFAFNGEERTIETLRQINGFEEATGPSKKTWKTWKTRHVS